MTEAERMAALERLGIPVSGPTLEEAEKMGLRGVRKYMKAAPAEAARRGLTSIPGIAKGLVKNPLQTAAIGAGSGGILGTGLVGGLTALQVPEAMRRATPEARSAGVGRAIGEGLGYTLGSAIPIVGNVALGSIGGRVGEVVGRGAQRLGSAVSRAPARTPVGSLAPRGV